MSVRQLPALGDLYAEDLCGARGAPDPVNRVVTESPASSTRESPPEPVVFAPDATTPAVSPPPVEAPKPPPPLPDDPMPCLN